MDLVSDCCWNPRYNMFAVAGFGQHFPVLVYVYQRSEDELNKVLMSGQGFQMGTEKANDFVSQKQRSLESPPRRTRALSSARENLGASDDMSNRRGEF